MNSLFLDPSLPWTEYRQQVTERLHRINANPCLCNDLAHDNALHDLARDDVPELIRRLDRAVESFREAAAR